MPNSVISDPAFGSPEENLQDLAARLQRDGGNRQALGRWTRFHINQLNLRALNAAAGGTVSGTNGSLGIVNLGETTMLSLQVETLTMGGNANGVIFQLPEGYSFLPRNQQYLNQSGIGPFSRVIVPCAINNAAVLVQGLMIIDMPKPSIITVYRDAAGNNYTNGVTSIFGQMFLENQFQTERQ